MQQVNENEMASLLTKFYASLHGYYSPRDTTPGIFVFATSTVLISFNILFIYDFIQYYFLDRIHLSKMGTLYLMIVVALANYYFMQKYEYKDVHPSKTFHRGVVIYIVASLGLMVFIATQYRELVVK